MYYNTLILKIKALIVFQYKLWGNYSLWNNQFVVTEKSFVI